MSKNCRQLWREAIWKSKCTKHTNVGPLLEVELWKKWTPLWREAHFEVKLLKGPHARTTFGSWDVEKVRTAVARGTFRSQSVQSTPTFGALLEVEMRKKATPLCGAEQISMPQVKNFRVRSTFGRSDVVLRGRRRGLCTLSKVSKTRGFCSNFNYNRCYTTLHPTTITTTTTTVTTLQYTALITLHYIPLHPTPLHSTTLNCTTLRYTNYNYNYNYITLQYTTLH